MEFKAMQGDSDAQYALGVAFFEGKDIPKNDMRTYVWVSLAKTQGHMDAGKMLETIAESLAPEQIIQAQNAASDFFDKARSSFNRTPEQRDAQRKSDVTAILDAMTVFGSDHPDQYKVIVSRISQDYPIEICPSWESECEGRVPLKELLGDYLTAIPADPKTATEESTRYTIRDAGGILTVTAPDSETA